MIFWRPNYSVTAENVPDHVRPDPHLIVDPTLAYPTRRQTSQRKTSIETIYETVIKCFKGILKTQLR